MAQSHSLSTDLPSLSFWSVFTGIMKRSTTPIPTAVQACFELGTGPFVERRRRDEENKVHPHIVMTWKGPAVDKLVSQKVLMTNVKEAEDFDLAPVFISASALVTGAMLHVPHQPSNITSIQLFVASVRWREPKACKPMVMKVVQILGYLFAAIFQRCMFLDTLCVIRI